MTTDICEARCPLCLAMAYWDEELKIWRHHEAELEHRIDLEPVVFDADTTTL